MRQAQKKKSCRTSKGSTDAVGEWNYSKGNEKYFACQEKSAVGQAGKDAVENGKESGKLIKKKEALVRFIIIFPEGKFNNFNIL